MLLPIELVRLRSAGATRRPAQLAGYAGAVIPLLIGVGCVRIAAVAREPAAVVASHVLGVDTTTRDTSLAGTFRWLDVDGRRPPADFPPGSDSTLLAGTLELFAVRRARDETSGTFARRFLLRPAPAARPRPMGEDGRFRVVGDSLHVMLEGRARRQPLRFRMEWRSGGTLRLTDTLGHVWTYARWVR